MSPKAWSLDILEGQFLLERFQILYAAAAVTMVS